MDQTQLLTVVHYSPRSWFYLSLFVLVSACNQMQRYSNPQAVISFVVSGSSMLQDTHTSEFQYGVLSGAVFLLVYALLAMPAVCKI
jgi:hypothetical protein